MVSFTAANGLGFIGCAFSRFSSCMAFPTIGAMEQTFLI